jgi:hypothetical protein
MSTADILLVVQHCVHEAAATATASTKPLRVMRPTCCCSRLDATSLLLLLPLLLLPLLLLPLLLRPVLAVHLHAWVDLQEIVLAVLVYHELNSACNQRH